LQELRLGLSLHHLVLNQHETHGDDDFPVALVAASAATMTQISRDPGTPTGAIFGLFLKLQISSQVGLF
jgi:hypothetical protein